MFARLTVWREKKWNEKRIDSELGLLLFCSVPARDTEPTVYRTLTGERGELKNLKVVLQRSPIAKQKLLRKATQETDSAKRTLDFDKNSRSFGSLDQYQSSRSFDQGARKPGRNTRAALRTESESEVSGYEREKDEGSLEVYSWLDTSRSWFYFSLNVLFMLVTRC